MATSRVRKPTDMSKEEGAAASPVTGKRRREKSKESRGKPAPAQDDDERASLAKKSGAKSKPTKDDVKPKPVTDDAAKPRPAMKQAAKTTPAQDDDEGTKSGKKSRGKPKPTKEDGVKPKPVTDDAAKPRPAMKQAAKTTPAQDDDEGTKSGKKSRGKPKPTKEDGVKPKPVTDDAAKPRPAMKQAAKTTPAQDDDEGTKSGKESCGKPKPAIEKTKSDMDLSNPVSALPPIGPQATPTTTGTLPPLEIKVMSWNIHGGGMAEYRNELVPAVVRVMNPDVLLLQETKTDKLVNLIKGQEVRAKDKSESRVLYNSNLFEAVSRDEKIFPGRDGMEISLSEALEMSLPEERGEPQETRSGRVEGMRDVFRRRIALVGLKRREHALVHDNVIVFISYHNLNNSRGRENKQEGAEGFCQIVQSMRQLTETVVIGGADLNLPVAHPAIGGADLNLPVVHPNAVIIQYNPTLRHAGRVIDYIARDAPPDRLEHSSVTALDFVGAAGDSTNLVLHQLMKDLLRPRVPEEPEVQEASVAAAGGTAVPDRIITIGDYDRAVDHDPLICTFCVTFPG